MDEHVSNRFYDSVDEILGDPATRYFGSGYRNVQQHVFDVQIGATSSRASATARVTYPDSWSTKTNHELVPHLSSIDGFVIATELLEAYLREAYALDDAGIQDCWIQHCTIKSGQTPTLDLERVPVGLQCTSTRADAGAMFGRYSEFTLKVGSLGLDLVIDHPVGTDTNERKSRTSFKAVDELLGEMAQRYYGGGFKTTHVAVRHLELSPFVDGASAKVHVTHAPQLVTRGLSGNYQPFISIPDALVATAQLAQVVLYRRDNLTRATSRNMWMRKISVTIPRPASLATDTTFEVKTWVAQASILPIGHSHWRAAKFKVTLPSMNSEFSLAHELPESMFAAAG